MLKHNHWSECCAFARSIFLFFFCISGQYLLAQPAALEKYSGSAKEYCLFLNAAAATDTDYLYNEKMGSDAQSAYIIRLGTPGNYSYEVLAGREDTPVSYVPKFAKTPFYNWLQESIDNTDTKLGKEEIDDFFACNKINLQIKPLNNSETLSLQNSRGDNLSSNSLLYSPYLKDAAAISLTLLAILMTESDPKYQNRASDVTISNQRYYRKGREKMNPVVQERVVSDPFALQDPLAEGALIDDDISWANYSRLHTHRTDKEPDYLLTNRDRDEKGKKYPSVSVTYSDDSTGTNEENEWFLASKMPSVSRSRENSSISSTPSTGRFASILWTSEQTSPRTTSSNLSTPGQIAVRRYLRPPQEEGYCPWLTKRFYDCSEFFSSCLGQEEDNEHSSSVTDPLLSEEDFAKMIRDSCDSNHTQETELTEQDSENSQDLQRAYKEASVRERAYIDLSTDPTEQFLVIAGDPRGLGGLLSQRHNNLTASLAIYSKNKHWSIEQKKESLRKIESLTQQYLQTREQSLQNKPSPEKKIRAQDRIEGCDLLLKGIEVERFALDHNTVSSEIRFKAEEVLHPKLSFSMASMSYPTEVSHHDGDHYVFKPENPINPVHSLIASAMGIPDAPRYNLSGRNVATYLIAQLLQSPLVPPTEFAIMKGGITGSCQRLVSNGKILFKEKATPLSKAAIHDYFKRSASTIEPIYDEGGNKIKTRHRTDEEVESEIKWHYDTYIHTLIEDPSNMRLPDNWILRVAPPLSRANEQGPIYENDEPISPERAVELFDQGLLVFDIKRVTQVDQAINFANPLLQQSMANAGIIDELTAQLDRNPLNLIYAQLPSGDWTVYLIDNDLSFPNKFKNLSAKQLLSIPEHGHILRQLPRLIDAKMALIIENLTPEEIRATLIGTNLTIEEIEATITRLEDLQQHIRNIKRGIVPGGKLVTEWNHETFSLLQQKVTGCEDTPSSHILDKNIQEDFYSDQKGTYHYQERDDQKAELTDIPFEQTEEFYDDNYLSRTLDDLAIKKKIYQEQQEKLRKAKTVLTKREP